MQDVALSSGVHEPGVTVGTGLVTRLSLRMDEPGQLAENEASKRHRHLPEDVLCLVLQSLKGRFSVHGVCSPFPSLLFTALGDPCFGCSPAASAAAMGLAAHTLLVLQA